MKSPHSRASQDRLRYASSPRAPASRSARFQLLLRIERQLDHALEQLLRGDAGEVFQHELLHIEPYQIAELQRAIFCCKYEVTMSVVDDDEITLGIEPGSPELPRRPLEGVARKPARVNDRGAHRGLETSGDRDQGFRGASDVALGDRHLQSRETRCCRCQVLDFLVDRASE